MRKHSHLLFLPIPAIPTSGLIGYDGIILAIQVIWLRGFWGSLGGYQATMYQTLGSPEQSMRVWLFGCLVMEVQVIPPLPA